MIYFEEEEEERCKVRQKLSWQVLCTECSDENVIGVGAMMVQQSGINQASQSTRANQLAELNVASAKA